MVVTLPRLAPLALAVAALGAQAQAAGDSPFTFSGFATLGVVSTNTDGAQYALYGQPNGADKSATGEVDSKLGLQGSYKLNSVFSGTVQVLTKQNGKGKFTPGFEWAFAKAQVTPSLALRLGRMGGPFFAVSDFRDVGYANTWLRPPQDVYGQVPVSHFDGADAIYQTPVGTSTLTTQVFAGKAADHAIGNKIKFDDLVGVNASLELDNGLTLRLGHAQAKLSISNASLTGLVTTLRATPFAAVGDALDPTRKKATFSGAGATFDQGDWLVNVEYTMRRTASYVADTDGWYATVGHRFGKFMPYLTVSKLTVEDSNVVNSIPASTALLAALKGGVDLAIAGQAVSQKTVAAGLRWDVYRNIALKTQVERISPTTRGLFVNPQPGFGGGHVNVYSLAVDTVF